MSVISALLIMLAQKHDPNPPLLQIQFLKTCICAAATLWTIKFSYHVMCAARGPQCHFFFVWQELVGNVIILWLWTLLQAWQFFLNVSCNLTPLPSSSWKVIPRDQSISEIRKQALQANLPALSWFSQCASIHCEMLKGLLAASQGRIVEPLCI